MSYFFFFILKNYRLILFLLMQDCVLFFFLLLKNYRLILFSRSPAPDPGPSHIYVEARRAYATKPG